MSNHFVMMGHYMYVYNASKELMAVPFKTIKFTPHIEDCLKANPASLPVIAHVGGPAYLQQPNSPQSNKFAMGIIVTIVVLFSLMNMVTLYTILRDYFYSTGSYNPQFCLRSASVSYH